MIINNYYYYYHYCNLSSGVFKALQRLTRNIKNILKYIKSDKNRRPLVENGAKYTRAGASACQEKQVDRIIQVVSTSIINSS